MPVIRQGTNYASRRGTWYVTKLRSTKAFYTGPDYSLKGVRIGPPAVGLLREGAAAEFSRWFDEARERDDVCYFSVYSGEALVGQILLHDENAGESLVGFHIFEPGQRGRGTGTKALTLLKRFVAEQTELSRLVIITSRDNFASRQLARKCGFVHIGAPREDPENGMVFEWIVPRDHTDGDQEEHGARRRNDSWGHGSG